MAQNHDDKCICPLFGRDILYGECYEVQEVRADEMDMSLAMVPFDLERAKKICDNCRWYIVSSGG